MTTNCLMRPRETYKDRIFTTNVVGWDGVKFVPKKEDGTKDFSEIIEKALELGASIIIVDEVKFDANEVKESGTIIKVENTRKALLELAKFYRKKLGLKVVGVTGSTGKTSTKDLIAAVLSKKYNVFKTKGNFNNDIGLPLMILELTSDYDVAILEMGMSSLGEIELLADVARPDIGVITNIGLSHIET